MSKRKYSLGMMLTMALALGMMFVASEALAGGGGGPTDLCGNGVIDPGETCDDANKIDCDGCDSAGITGAPGACTISACGNDVLCTTSTDPNAFPIEECDPPNGTTCGVSCLLVPQALTKGQQKCVNGINKKALQLVEKAQAKENEKCVKDYQKAKLAGSVQDCTTADANGKVGKKKDKVIQEDNKRCQGENMPTFAYTNAGTANVAAELAPRDFMAALFGNPIAADPADPNTALVTKDQDKDTAKCQLDMLKRANKLDDAIVKEVLKAKKDALKGKKGIPQVTTSTELETQLNLALSSPVKGAKAGSKLRSSTNKKCQALIFPTKRFQGFCGDGVPTLTALQDCIIAAVTCDVCRKFEAADALDLDCDAAAAAVAPNGACTPIM